MILLLKTVVYCRPVAAIAAVKFTLTQGISHKDA